RDWLGPPPRVEREAALAELARRYLAGHAPADDRDLAKWAGLPLRDARAGLAQIAGEVEVRDEPARACLLDRWDPVLVRSGARGLLPPPLPPPRPAGGALPPVGLRPRTRGRDWGPARGRGRDPPALRLARERRRARARSRRRRRRPFLRRLTGAGARGPGPRPASDDLRGLERRADPSRRQRRAPHPHTRRGEEPARYRPAPARRARATR